MQVRGREEEGKEKTQYQKNLLHRISARGDCQSSQRGETRNHPEDQPGAGPQQIGQRTVQTLPKQEAASDRSPAPRTQQRLVAEPRNHGQDVLEEQQTEAEFVSHPRGRNAQGANVGEPAQPANKETQPLHEFEEDHESRTEQRF